MGYLASFAKNYTILRKNMGFKGSIGVLNSTGRYLRRVSKIEHYLEFNHSKYPY